MWGFDLFPSCSALSTVHVTNVTRLFVAGGDAFAFADGEQGLTDIYHLWACRPLRDDAKSFLKKFASQSDGYRRYKDWSIKIRDQKRLMVCNLVESYKHALPAHCAAIRAACVCFADQAQVCLCPPSRCRSPYACPMLIRMLYAASP